MRLRTLRAGLPLVAMSLLTAAIPGVATAAGTTDAAPARHCAFHADTGQQHCFDTLAEATGSAGAAAADTRDGEVVQGTLFDEENYGGDSFTIYGSGLCEKDGWVDYQIDLPDDWKDRVTSVQPWGDCWIWLYPEPGLGGDRDGPFKENTAYVGDLMNDRTQSVGLS
ncbi:MULTISPECIES: hypothetical protein [unclassified Saccharopolyspora]|uniref:hypothetical protein n=1 Tax=unclassified Saccharopolyspora TaxID=2646250 RepID=UPI001CD280A0|nr:MULTISPECIES: hypothetical protein [unclassified Saccharopolyspora]MCA1186366.1 hypothetical protein [Saccharopolyspora sp. 6T]MCA1225725.1 hypothetical protein [Saccharopolyspora sp. 6M]MCA1278593.1 hypothetical protein [Saccharopolyspora sp. 7B]